MQPTHRFKDLQFVPAQQTNAFVCPDGGRLGDDPPCKTSEWTRKMFDFQPSVKQAELLDCDAKYLILCCNRQWGKTTTIAFKALHHAIIVPGISIVVISRTKDQAGLLLEKVSDAAVRLGFPIRRVLGQRFSFKLPNASQICAIAHDEDSSIGRTANILIVDEAARVKDKVFFSVAPFIARTHGSLWLLSTPRGQDGFFYNYWHDKDPRWRRIFSNVHDCPDVEPEFLALQEQFDPHSYRQDFLCEFIQLPDRLVTREFLSRMLGDD